MRISETGWSNTPPVEPHGSRAAADPARTSAGADSLELSETAQAFRAWVQSAQHVDAATQSRIEALRHAVASGTYRPAPEHVAARMLAEARAQRHGHRGPLHG